MRIKQLNEYLPLHGLAFPVLGSVGEQARETGGGGGAGQPILEMC